MDEEIAYFSVISFIGIAVAFDCFITDTLRPTHHTQIFTE